MKQLKNDTAILNIFKDDSEYVEDFVRHHAPMVKQLVMLNTGNEETYKIVKELQSEYDNITVSYKEYPVVDFGKYRNDCLALAKKSVDCEYFIWVDTDERLEVFEEEEFNTDIVCLERLDASNRFATYIDRIYRSTIKGKWIKIIHEHFATEYSDNTRGHAHGMKLSHLTSEADRPMEKKRLYYSLLARQLSDAEKAGYKQGKIDAIQHMILMASHDFRNPELCVQLYETHAELISSLGAGDQISSVQKINILIHSLMSFARLGKAIPEGLVEEILKIDNSKSTYFQVMRAMVFDPKNRPQIKQMYEVDYLKLGEPDAEFNNLDYLVEKEIKWFEGKLYGK